MQRKTSSTLFKNFCRSENIKCVKIHYKLFYLGDRAGSLKLSSFYWQTAFCHFMFFILTEHLSYHLQHPPLLLLNKISIWRQPIQTGFKQINKTFVDLLSVVLCIQEHYCDFLLKVNPRTMCFWQHEIFSFPRYIMAFSYEITQTWCIKNLLVVNLLCWSFYSTLHHSLLPKCHNKKKKCWCSMLDLMLLLFPSTCRK